jgi:hypothetical protein
VDRVLDLLELRHAMEVGELSEGGDHE